MRRSLTADIVPFHARCDGCGDGPEVICKRPGNKEKNLGGEKWPANRIFTTHVGSLVRPPKLVEFLHQIEDRQPYDQAAYEACLRQSIEEVVQHQADAGIDIVSDGEYSKGRNWAFYVHDRLTGVTTRSLTAEEAKDPMASVGGGQDRVAVPGILRRIRSGFRPRASGSARALWSTRR